MKQYRYIFILTLSILFTPFHSQGMNSIQDMITQVTTFLSSDTGTHIIALLLALELLTYDEESSSDEEFS